MYQHRKGVETPDIRILGRQIGRELTLSELDQVSGGEDPLDDSASTGTDTHPGTCTKEKDCDN